MSLMSALMRVPEYLVEPITNLIVDLVTSPNPREAVERARRSAIADASDAATDAALKELLK